MLIIEVRMKQNKLKIIDVIPVDFSTDNIILFNDGTYRVIETI